MKGMGIFLAILLITISVAFVSCGRGQPTETPVQPAPMLTSTPRPTSTPIPSATPTPTPKPTLTPGLSTLLVKGEWESIGPEGVEQIDQILIMDEIIYVIQVKGPNGRHLWRLNSWDPITWEDLGVGTRVIPKSERGEVLWREYLKILRPLQKRHQQGEKVPEYEWRNAQSILEEALKEFYFEEAYVEIGSRKIPAPYTIYGGITTASGGPLQDAPEKQEFVQKALGLKYNRGLHVILARHPESPNFTLAALNFPTIKEGQFTFLPPRLFISGKSGPWPEIDISGIDFGESVSAISAINLQGQEDQIVLYLATGFGYGEAKLWRGIVERQSLP